MPFNYGFISSFLLPQIMLEFILFLSKNPPPKGQYKEEMTCILKQAKKFDNIVKQVDSQKLLTARHRYLFSR